MLAVTARSHCGYRGFCSSGDVPKVQPWGRGPTTLYVNRIGLGLSVLLIPALRQVPLLLCGSSKAAPAPSSQARVPSGPPVLWQRQLCSPGCRASTGPLGDLQGIPAKARAQTVAIST